MSNRLPSWVRTIPAFGLIAGLMVAFPSAASQPASASMSAKSSAVTFNGTALGGSSPEGETTCVEGVNCDSFQLTITGGASDWSRKNARVSLSWLLPATDYDVYIHKDSVTGPVVASSAQGTTTAESTDINVAQSGTGDYVVRVVYFTAVGDQYMGRAEVVAKPADNPARAPLATPPTYANFAAPVPLGQGAGEPTLGNNWASGNTMFIAGLETLRVTFNDTNGTASWIDRSALNTSITTFDPILFTDWRTNRTFVSQLLPTKISLMAFTDDDGEAWTPSMGAGINAGVDHQTVGGGPFKPGVPLRGPLTDYPNAVYYASQDIGLAEIALSRDGGLTFEVAVPMWNLTQCNGLHGHIKVAAGRNGLRSQQELRRPAGRGGLRGQRPAPGASAKCPAAPEATTDPSLGIGSNGTVYFGFVNGDGTARAAVSHDRGLTWSASVNLGAIHNVRNAAFAAATAGDDDRGAIFFLGTSTPGASGVGTDMAFDGTWYGYIATTYDGGMNWVTVNATGNDPAQRGVVCTQGTTCPSGTRNLLDFNDLEIDAKGRPLAAFADGCITADCRSGIDRSGPGGTPDGKIDSYDNDGEDVATIIRQASGRTLLAAYDAPNAPTSLWVVPTAADVTLHWTDNAGNETSYIIERSSAPTSGFTQLATTPANSTSYVDDTVTSNTTYYYRVQAANANGTSAYSNIIRASVK